MLAEIFRPNDLTPEILYFSEKSIVDGVCDVSGFGIGVTIVSDDIGGVTVRLIRSIQVIVDIPPLGRYVWIFLVEF